MKHTYTKTTKILLIFCAAATIALMGPADILAGEDGGYAGAQVRWGVGARPVAMGGAFASVANGPIGFWWNPAGVAQERNNQIETAWRAMSFDRQAGYVSFVHPFGKEQAAMALSWIHAGVGDIYESDIDGPLDNNFSNYTNVGTFSFARQFTRGMALGVNLRYLQQNLANISAYTIGFDFGVHLKFIRDQYLGRTRIPLSKISIGAVVQQINQKYPWTTSDYWVERGEGGAESDEKFPLIFRNGISGLFMKDRLLLAIDAEFSDKLDPRMHFGAEVRPVETLALRGGLDDSNPTFGAGFWLKTSMSMQLILDYAYASQPGLIDAEHMFSLGVRF